ncbi:MAG: MSMEG_4193 family putative phosphomutase [Anaerolineales bacterium]|nr:MSMEG_4193 family putative phosphomutase [Anaerolineales bacterium]MCB0010360.1 MSMEG_4193 family putative phosphomutase [Anaerolineales bacterium]MCB0016385.1 MSMEG_4193 family putative phosphomutase [Anaerolineales bacterium]MCB0027189.1 MSMEG_4193 family putative phosphomutase [Anaerolineales bacterium]MCB8958810.1 MSMEG_4193 family putative phosphomutase [Ardenticatenales bacterium]
MTTIILVRHGQNDWVNKHRLAGWIPGVHLNEVGQQQAQAAAERLAPLPIKAIYSSPVLRCMETANFIAAPHQLPIEELPDVGEVRYGEWEGKKIKKLAKKKEWFAVQHFPSRFQFPEGESLRAVQNRAVEMLEQLASKHPKDYIIVVSHADLIKLVLAHYLGVHMDLFQRIVISPAAASVLQLHENGVVRVLRLNDDGPLQPPPPEKPAAEEKDEKEKAKKAKKKKK